MLTNMKLAAIPAAILGILAGATIAFKDIHDIRNAVVEQQQREQEQIEQALRDRLELERAEERIARQMQGAGQAIQGFTWPQIPPAALKPPVVLQPSNHVTVKKGTPR